MRACAWCLQPIPAHARRDAVCCSQRCRQARHRFRVAPAAAATDRPRRFGYADPPYPGLARRYYGHDEVDHAALVDRLEAECPDGWALSTSSSPGLRLVLPLCPRDVRVSAFVRGGRQVVAYRPRDAWEALIVRGGRPRRTEPLEVRDNVLEVRGGRHHSHPGALVGMKPPEFAEWLFDELGARRGDELVDYFPGSGAIGRAWALFQGDEARWVREYSRDASLVDVERIETSLGAGERVAEGLGDTSCRAARRVASRSPRHVELGRTRRDVERDVSPAGGGDV